MLMPRRLYPASTLGAPLLLLLLLLQTLSVTAPPPRPMSVTCPTNLTGASYAGAAAYIGKGPKAAPSRGNVGCVDVGPLATRATATVGGNAVSAVNIFGPMEAGFSSSQPGASCLGTNVVAGGIDTNLAEAIITHLCKPAVFGAILDYCGGHASTYHYHERMACLYKADNATQHSTRVGTALDGNGIYGHHVNGGCEPTDLDACGGRTGVTPDSGGKAVYYYVITNRAPFVLGCFGKKGHFTTVDECRALYPTECGDGDKVTLTTEHGSGQYDLDCPCFDAVGSNVPGQGKPGFLAAVGYEQYTAASSALNGTSVFCSSNTTVNGTTGNATKGNATANGTSSAKAATKAKGVGYATPSYGKSANGTFSLPSNISGVAYRNKCPPTQRCPLLIMLHGANSNGLDLDAASTMETLFSGIVAYPSESTSGGGSWATTPSSSQWAGNLAMINALIAMKAVDPSRVYVLGYSNGGFFAYALHCAIGNRLSAVVVSAGLMGKQPRGCRHRTNVLHFHNAKDPLIRPIDSNATSKGVAQYGAPTSLRRAWLNGTDNGQAAVVHGEFTRYTARWLSPQGAAGGNKSFNYYSFNSTRGKGNHDYVVYPAGAAVGAPGATNMELYITRFLVNTTAPSGLVLSHTSVNVSEGSATPATYTVRLVSQPAANVRVEFASVPANQVAMSPAWVVFTPGNWSHDRLVNVRAVDDTLLEDRPHKASIRNVGLSVDTRFNGVAATVAVAIGKGIASCFLCAPPPRCALRIPPPHNTTHTHTHTHTRWYVRMTRSLSNEALSPYPNPPYFSLICSFPSPCPHSRSTHHSRQRTTRRWCSITLSFP